MPKVSVIIPAYNAERYIQQAIDSVLAQTYRDYEIVVVDDGSTDKTRVCVVSYGSLVKYVYQEHQTLPVARNTGVAASDGEFLAFLDSDDLSLPNRMEIQVAGLDQQPQVGLVASGYQFVDENCRIIREERPWELTPRITLETLLSQGLTPPSAVLMRREWFEKVGGFDPRFSSAEDMDLWYRLSLEGCPIEWKPAIVSQYRIHGDNSTRHVKEHFRNFFLVLDQLFSREDLPPCVRERRKEIYACKYLSQAGSLYACGNIEEARSSLRAAIVLDPALCGGDGAQILEWISAWYTSPWVQNKQRLISNVAGNLPTELSMLSEKTVRRHLQKAEFYKAYERNDNSTIRKLWPSIAFHDMKWLLNRGTWSILAKSLGLEIGAWFSTGASPASAKATPNETLGTRQK